MKNSIPLTLTRAGGALCLLVLTTHLPAQTSAFTYQGALSQNGQPANGTYDFMFRLLDAETDGTAAPVIPINPGVGVTNGLFTTGINFDAENLNGANLWLEISVRTNGGSTFTTLAPRQLLTSAPYAVKALEAVTAAEAVSVPQGTINSAMLADGAVTSSKIAPGAVSQLGSPDASNTGAVQVNDDGLVGIGTGTPIAGLHVSTGTCVLGAYLKYQGQDGMGSFTNLNGAWGVAAFGDILAVTAMTDDAVTLLRVNSFGAPTLLSQISDGSGGFNYLNGAAGVAIDGDLLAVAAIEDAAVSLIDISVPSSPVLIAELHAGVSGFDDLSAARQVALSNGLLVITHGADSVTLVDVSTPSNPVRRAVLRDNVGGFDNLSGPGHVALSGGLLAVAARNDNAVTLIDVSNPVLPVLRATLKDGIGGFNSLEGAQGVEFSGSLLAIAAYFDSAVTLVDVSDPSNPVLRSVIENGIGGSRTYNATDLSFQGNLLVVSAPSADALTLIDVGEPSQPVVKGVFHQGLGGINYMEYPVGVAFAGNTLAVASAHSSGLMLIVPSETRFSIASEGWLAVGTVVPMAPLHVRGNMIVEGAETLELRAHQIALGHETLASGHLSIAMGTSTISSGRFSTAMGYSTIASGIYSTAMGYETTASSFATTAIGDNTLASGAGASALGRYTTASGSASTAMGSNTTASGDYSIAMGIDSQATNWWTLAARRNARAYHTGSLVLADGSTNSVFESARDNEFSVRAAGGFRLVSNSNSTSGVSLAPNDTAWSVISDRAVKKDFAAVDGREVLEKLAAVPVQSWHYQWESADATPHLGPVAQDFKAAFYPGRDDRSITTLEFDGVALAAIQGLNQKLEARSQESEARSRLIEQKLQEELHRRDTENAELKRQNRELLKRLEAIEARLR